MNEMELLNMTSRQKLSWLMASRITLMVVGMVWIAMTGWQFLFGGYGWFLLAMAPAFAVFWYLMYRFYQRLERPGAGEEDAR